MYLNVNLTPPQSGGSDGSSTNTPKTPEILNSLISLTTTNISTYTSYQCQASAGDLLSPASSSASPSEETPISQFGLPLFGNPNNISGTQMSPSNTSDPGGGGVITRVTGIFQGVAGTPSPPMPELPSPVSSVEATKSALIKEGLKHQIKSKLMAAGLDTCELLNDQKLVKEEVSDSGELTPQDEERRLRRRERNKIAATKCRNKKKEMTVILMSESETVEDQNIRLKSEIQRLTSEKKKLEKLLKDPNHIASCKHTSKCSRHPQPPTVLITSPDAPEQLLPSPSAEGSVLLSLGVSKDSGQGSSEQSSDLISCLSFCPPSVPSCETSYRTETSSPSFNNLSPTISMGSLPSVSSPQLVFASKQFSQQTSYVEGAFPISFTEESNLLSLSPPSKVSSQSLLANPVPTSNSNPNLPQETPTPTSIYISKPSKHHFYTQKRLEPYTVSRSSKTSYPYNTNVHVQQDLQESDYFSLSNELAPVSNKYSYHELQQNLTLSGVEIPLCDNPPLKNNYVGKSRTMLSTVSNSYNRYTPYTLSDRHHVNYVPTTSCSIAEVSQCLPYVPATETYLQTSCNNESTFLSDISPAPFYP